MKTSKSDFSSIIRQKPEISGAGIYMVLDETSCRDLDWIELVVVVIYQILVYKIFSVSRMRFLSRLISLCFLKRSVLFNSYDLNIRHIFISAYCIISGRLFPFPLATSFKCHVPILPRLYLPRPSQGHRKASSQFQHLPGSGILGFGDFENNKQRFFLSIRP